MQVVKFLAECIMYFIGCLTSSVAGYPYKAVIGGTAITSIIAIYILSAIFFNWWIAIFITLGCISAVCIMCVLVELLIRLFHKGKKE